MGIPQHWRLSEIPMPIPCRRIVVAFHQGRAFSCLMWARHWEVVDTKYFCSHLHIVLSCKPLIITYCGTKFLHLPYTVLAQEWVCIYELKSRVDSQIFACKHRFYYLRITRKCNILRSDHPINYMNSDRPRVTCIYEIFGETTLDTIIISATKNIWLHVCYKILVTNKLDIVTVTTNVS